MCNSYRFNARGCAQYEHAVIQLHGEGGGGRAGISLCKIGSAITVMLLAFPASCLVDNHANRTTNSASHSTATCVPSK